MHTLVWLAAWRVSARPYSVAELAVEEKTNEKEQSNVAVGLLFLHSGRWTMCTTTSYPLVWFANFLRMNRAAYPRKLPTVFA